MIEYWRRCVREQSLADFLSRHAFFQWMAGVISRDGGNQRIFDGAQLRCRDQYTRHLGHQALGNETVDECLALVPWHSRPACEPIDRQAGQTSLANHCQNSVSVRFGEAREARRARRRAYASSWG